MKEPNNLYYRAILIGLSFLLFACGNSNSDKIVDSFIQDIVKDIEQLSVKSTIEISVSKHDIFKPMLPRMDNNGNFIIINSPIWEIFLIDPSGELLAKAGGHGQAPGKFLNVSPPVITEDNRLFILDQNQQRVTEYLVTSQDILFQRVISLDVNYSLLPTGARYRFLYLADAGIFGVFIVPKGMMRNEFHIYRLDEIFTPIEKVIAFEEHYPNILLSHLAVSNIGWFTDEFHLNYFYKDSLVVYSKNLVDGTTLQNSLTDRHRDRVSNELNKALIDSRYASVLNDPILNNRRSNDSETLLPILQSSFGDGNSIVSQITYYGGDYVALLHYNLQTKERKWIKMHPDFYLHGISGNTIYGLINRWNGETTILIKEI